MIGLNNKVNIIGVSRVRNVDFIIKDVLDHLMTFVDFVIIYDDASTDKTLDILKAHPIVKEVIENEKWVSNRDVRAKAEGGDREMLYNKAKMYNPDWIYVFDADEFIEPSVDFSLLDKEVDAYYFRLFDYYITPDDLNLSYKERKFIGPEYRDIPMLFNASFDLKFKARVPDGLKFLKKGGYVKHYGKAISLKAWNDKCLYYINNLKENQPGGIDISDKWRARLDKAVHTKSDFNRELITWDQKDIFGFKLSHDFEKISSLKISILVASHNLARVGGSETFTYTLISELVKNPNFSVEYFCFKKGVVSNRIEALGVSFMTKKRYDFIFANHNTVVNKLYKKGFIIQTCHGIYPSLEQPSNKANGYVSISQEIQEHLNVKGYRSKIIYNSIDLTRFYSKSPINKKPVSILSLCHSEEANLVIMKLCKDLGLEYLEAFKYEDSVWEIQDVINKADVVFGLGRSAYEAMACGRPVIAWDKRGYFSSYSDGYLKNNLGFSLLNNCSGRYSENMLTQKDLIEELKYYNSNDQDYFREFALKHLDVRTNIVQYISYAYELKQYEINNRMYYKIYNALKKRQWTPRIFKRILKKIKRLVK